MITNNKDYAFMETYKINYSISTENYSSRTLKRLETTRKCANCKRLLSKNRREFCFFCIGNVLTEKYKNKKNGKINNK